MSGWAFYKNISAEPAYVGAKTANKTKNRLILTIKRFLIGLSDRI